MQWVSCNHTIVAIVVVTVAVVVVPVVVVVAVIVVVSAWLCRCEIDWKPGMNVTQKKVKKTQQHRSHPGAKRTIVKTVQNDSFFNFFSPPEGDKEVHCEA